ncbi:hypothetical protein Lal_00042973 [Lupinus albus]|nr:hypothetical protein Lal_00042973 [Lupinus albus]
MSDMRPKRVKHTVGISTSLLHPRKQRNTDNDGSTSTQAGRINVGKDPYYTPALQAERLAKFIVCKLTYIRYANMARMVEQGFQFPLELEGQGAKIFFKLHGNIFPSLVREFYSNFQYKDGREPHYYIQHELIKDGSMIVENRLLYYLISYVLVQRNTNHAQPTSNDLKLMDYGELAY